MEKINSKNHNQGKYPAELSMIRRRSLCGDDNNDDW